MLTPSESASVASIYAVALGIFVYRELGWKNFWTATRTTAHTTAVIFAIIAMAVYFSIIMTYTKTPQAIVQFFIDYNIGPITFMILAGVAILILGTFIEAVPVFYLTMPILYPLCAALKIDLLHFYVFVTGLIGLGLITPPVCVGVYTAAAILGTPPQQAFRYVPGFTPENFLYVQTKYAENAFLAIFAAALTPIPYKVFTVASGVFEAGLEVLVAASVLGRGLRFFAVAGLLRWLGAPVRVFIDRHFNTLTVVFFLLLAVGFLLIRWLF